MPNEPQSKDLIVRLVEKTKSGELSWQHTAQAGRYQVKLGQYVIQVANSRYSSPENIFANQPRMVSIGSAGIRNSPQLSILNLEGNLIESYEDSTLDLVNSPEFNVHNLYKTAERSAAGADRAISDILGLLK